MARHFSALVVACLSLAPGAARAVALAAPASVHVDTGGAEVQVTWSAVEGAGGYGVAVFAPVDAEGKRPLQAAIWVKAGRNSYLYGKDPVLAKAGTLPSTKPLKLSAGVTYRVMVAAAKTDGSDKSPWAATDFTSLGAQVSLTPTPSPSPSPSPTPGSVSDDAELVVELDEFKAKPEGAVLDVGDHAEGASMRSGLVEQAAPEASSTSASLPTDVPGARALLKAGQPNQSETALRAILAKDASNADAWEALGEALDARRLKVEALEAFEKALALDPKRGHLKEWIEKNTRR